MQYFEHFYDAVKPRESIGRHLGQHRGDEITPTQNFVLKCYHSSVKALYKGGKLMSASREDKNSELLQSDFF